MGYTFRLTAARPGNKSTPAFKTYGLTLLPFSVRIFTQESGTVYGAWPLSEIVSGVVNVSDGVPSRFALEQNYPNPLTRRPP